MVRIPCSSEDFSSSFFPHANIPLHSLFRISSSTIERLQVNDKVICGNSISIENFIYGHDVFLVICC